jgi:hypothetical protein
MLSGTFWLRIGVGGVVGNIPDAVRVAGGMLRGLSGIFPTLFGQVVYHNISGR